MCGDLLLSVGSTVFCKLIQVVQALHLKAAVDQHLSEYWLESKYTATQIIPLSFLRTFRPTLITLEYCQNP